MSSLQHCQSSIEMTHHFVTFLMKSPKHRSHPRPQTSRIHAAMIPAFPSHSSHHQGRSSYERLSRYSQQTISSHPSTMPPTVASGVLHLLSIVPPGWDCCGAALALCWMRSWRFDVENGQPKTELKKTKKKTSRTMMTMSCWMVVQFILSVHTRVMYIYV